MSSIIKPIVILAIAAGVLTNLPGSSGEQVEEKLQEITPIAKEIQTKIEDKLPIDTESVKKSVEKHIEKLPKQTEETLTEADLDDTQGFLMEILPFLPERQTWPEPVDKFFTLFTLKETVEQKTASMEWTPLNEIPLKTQQALIAIEDHDFYNHGAIAPEGILRAILVNLISGEIQQGGSTITQQLAKNLFLNGEQTMSRKVYELMFALMLEDRYTKDEILELYFNTTYFGNGATGITAASRSYFGKAPYNLTLAESAVIAALPNAPSALNPYNNPDECKNRQRLVLSSMNKRGYIDKDTANKAKKQTVRLANGKKL